MTNSAPTFPPTPLVFSLTFTHNNEFFPHHYILPTTSPITYNPCPVVGFVRPVISIIRISSGSSSSAGSRYP